MKKILFTLPIVGLLAVACHSSPTINNNRQSIPTPQKDQMPNPTTSKTIKTGNDTTVNKIIIPQSKFEIKSEGSKADQWIPTNITEKDIANAEAKIFNTPNGITSTAITITFDPEGKNKFFKATSENIFKDLGIFIDGKLISAPVVLEAISNGTCVFTVSMNLDEATTLSNNLRGYYYQTETKK